MFLTTVLGLQETQPIAVHRQGRCTDETVSTESDRQEALTTPCFSIVLPCFHAEGLREGKQHHSRFQRSRWLLRGCRTLK